MLLLLFIVPAISSGLLGTMRMSQPPFTTHKHRTALSIANTRFCSISTEAETSSAGSNITCDSTTTCYYYFLSLPARPSRLLPLDVLRTIPRTTILTIHNTTINQRTNIAQHYLSRTHASVRDKLGSNIICDSTTTCYYYFLSLPGQPVPARPA